MTTLAATDTQMDVTSGSVVVRVEFEALDGRRFRAIGGGATIGDAIAFARASTPSGSWRAIRVDDLYGD